MLNIKEFEAKTLDEALEKAMVELNCEKENLLYNYEFIEAKLFKSSKYKINVVEKSNIKEYLIDYLIFQYHLGKV